MELKGLTSETEMHNIPLRGQLKAMQAGGLDAVRTAAELWPGKSVEDIVQRKEDYMRDVNPTGEVPTLKTVAGSIVTEADVVAEYLEDKFPDLGVSLKPKDDALTLSKIRHSIKIVNSDNGVRAMYGLLMNQDKEKDAAFTNNLYKGLSSIAKLASESGPFFSGETISLADVMLIPFWDQFRYLLPHYRGVEMIPGAAADGAHPWAARLRTWAAAVEKNDAFQKLRVDEASVIKAYTGYAGARNA